MHVKPALVSLPNFFALLKRITAATTVPIVSINIKANINSPLILSIDYKGLDNNGKELIVARVILFTKK